MFPEPYSISETRFECRACGAVFQWRHADAYSLVKFISDDGSEERWLPTYGESGYLELLQRLVPSWRPESAITRSVADAFDRALGKLLERNNLTRFRIETGKVCPRCSSKELTIVSEVVLANPPIERLEVPMEE